MSLAYLEATLFLSSKDHVRGGVTRHGASADIEKGIFGKEEGETTEEDKLGRKAGEKGEGGEKEEGGGGVFSFNLFFLEGGVCGKGEKKVGSEQKMACREGREGDRISFSPFR